MIVHYDTVMQTVWIKARDIRFMLYIAQPISATVLCWHCFSVEMEKQLTVAVIKPDAVKAGLVDEIIQKVQ